MLFTTHSCAGALQSNRTSLVFVKMLPTKNRLDGLPTKNSGARDVVADERCRDDSSIGTSSALAVLLLNTLLLVTI